LSVYCDSTSKIFLILSSIAPSLPLYTEDMGECFVSPSSELENMLLTMLPIFKFNTDCSWRTSSLCLL